MNNFIICLLALLFFACENPAPITSKEDENLIFYLSSPIAVPAAPNPSGKTENSFVLCTDTDLHLEKIYLPAMAADFSLKLKKNRLTPVLLYLNEADETPLGCIYPLSRRLSHKSGFSAHILKRLFLISREPPAQIYSRAALFNWLRFDLEIQKWENPWSLDQELILRKIADGSFNIYSLRKKSN